MCSFVFAFVEMCGHVPNGGGQLLWVEDYAEACKMSQVAEKPMLIAFVGSDWCPWSQKLIHEVLEQPDFISEMRHTAILVWIDFPEQSALTAERKAQNQALKSQFQISELPTLLLLDTAGRVVARSGFLPLKPKEMAERLKSALRDGALLDKVVDRKEYAEMDGEELQVLYKRAEELGKREVQQLLLKEGVAAQKGGFFLMRQYEELLRNAKLKEPAVKKLRQKIIEEDPDNEQGLHLELAIAEFQALAKRLQRKEKPDGAIKPLVEYIRNYGAEDLENSWRLEMMIAQFLYSKNAVQQALAHAETSLELAPEEYREEITRTLDFLSEKRGNTAFKKQ